jgi:hypothetical protein
MNEDNNQLSPDLTQEERQRLRLELQLNEAATAERFFESATGKLWTEIATFEITQITRDITSEKYRKDPTGYNNALSDLLAYKRILRKMQVAASPERAAKIREKLDEPSE